MILVNIFRSKLKKSQKYIRGLLGTGATGLAAIQAARLNRLRLGTGLNPVRQPSADSLPVNERARGRQSDGRQINRVKRETVSIVFPSSSPLQNPSRKTVIVPPTNAVAEISEQEDGVSIVYPQSAGPSLKRDSRQIDLTLPSVAEGTYDELAETDEQPEKAPPSDDIHDEDYEDYEGWETIETVDKSVSEHFSVSSLVNSVVEAVTTTIAPFISSTTALLTSSCNE